MLSEKAAFSSFYFLQHSLSLIPGCASWRTTSKKGFTGFNLQCPPKPQWINNIQALLIYFMAWPLLGGGKTLILANARRNFVLLVVKSYFSKLRLFKKLYRILNFNSELQDEMIYTFL